MSQKKRCDGAAVVGPVDYHQLPLVRKEDWPDGPRTFIATPFKALDRRVDLPLGKEIAVCIEAEVRLDSLYASQSVVCVEGMDKPRDDSYGLPLVVRSNGADYIQDGHHRLAKEAFGGGQVARVRFLDLDTLRAPTSVLEGRLGLRGAAVDAGVPALIERVAKVFLVEFMARHGVSCVREINQGLCVEFAEELEGELRDHGIKATQGHRDYVEAEFRGIDEETLVVSDDWVLPHHVWVEAEGRCYDAEAPLGVPSWRELPIFQRYFDAGFSVPSVTQVQVPPTLNRAFQPERAPGTKVEKMDYRNNDGNVDGHWELWWDKRTKLFWVTRHNAEGEQVGDAMNGYNKLELKQQMVWSHHPEAYRLEYVPRAAYKTLP